MSTLSAYMRNIYTKLRLFNQTQCGGAMCFKDKHKPKAIRGHTLFKTMGGLWRGQGLLNIPAHGLASQQAQLGQSEKDRSWRSGSPGWEGDFNRFKKCMITLGFSQHLGWARCYCQEGRSGVVNDAQGNLWIFAVKLQQLGAKAEKKQAGRNRCLGQETRNINVTWLVCA